RQWRVKTYALWLFRSNLLALDIVVMNRVCKIFRKGLMGFKGFQLIHMTPDQLPAQKRLSSRNQWHPPDSVLPTMYILM
uniref:Uncharacterized protein n=1 Tax=Chelydra serpentina TaxID=8475 RepID=A0A8C3SEL7_CHESE